MPTRPPAVTQARAATDLADVLTVDAFCALLNVSKDTFYHWRKVRSAPPCYRLPNGALRIRRPDFESWLDGLREPA